MERQKVHSVTVPAKEGVHWKEFGVGFTWKKLAKFFTQKMLVNLQRFAK